MTTYYFDYEQSPRRRGAVGQADRKNQKRAAQRAKGIVFFDAAGSGSYYYDLRTRHPIGARVKRGFDLLFATVAITLLSPVFLLLAALVKLSSPGPIIFRQRRIGFRCNQFDMYKFRTMIVGAHLQEKALAEKEGKSFLKLKNDPRVTKIGRVLRKYSLDELPQLFNVLEGTMSIVGPRPLLVSDLDKLPRRSGLTRFSTPPGITGLWQVSGRSSCSDLKRLRLDRHYVEHWSLALDFEILLRTIDVVVTGQDAV
ncbi:MAG TPA: sugar transferase [Thermoanaerobaculia bacterium]|jgi:lipopolysaccharide/colanic/teichoic acid biosynthesis glycosyltransferase